MVEWQTRYFEVVVGVISCEFKSHLVHHICWCGSMAEQLTCKKLQLYREIYIENLANSGKPTVIWLHYGNPELDNLNCRV